MLRSNSNFTVVFVGGQRKQATRLLTLIMSTYHWLADEILNETLRGNDTSWLAQRQANLNKIVARLTPDRLFVEDRQALNAGMAEWWS
jgi:hypothetical protein